MSEDGDISSLLHAGARIVLVAPHPDDESLATGGLIQRALAERSKVSVALLTDGDMNPWPQRVAERRLVVRRADRERWGRIRRKEAFDALQCLGVDSRDVFQLGLPDMGLTSMLADDPWGACEPLTATFRENRPSVVVEPALRDTHPDHSAAHVMTSLALERAGCDAIRLTYVVHGNTARPGEILEFDPPTRARKLHALEQHRTQLRLSRARMLRYAERPEKFTIEHQRTQVPREPGAVTVLPWRMSLVAMPFVSLLIVTCDESARVVPTREPFSASSDTAHCRRCGDGSMELRLPASQAYSGLVFARLESRLPSPWIYDRWGWTQIA